MSTIIEKLTARIEEYYATNKNPCKNYATEEAAKKATKKWLKKRQHILTLKIERMRQKQITLFFMLKKWDAGLGVLI